jgi:tetratricopeptide (TPR) repeat protein
MRIDDLRRLIDDYFEKEDFERSLEYCDLLFKDNASEVTTDDIFKKGLCHYKLEDNESAIGCFDRALEAEPDNILALTNKGICLYSLDRISEAFGVFNTVLKLNPNVFPAWYYIGMYYLPKFTATGDPGELAILINAYRQVVRMAPDFGAFPVYDPVKKMEYRLDTFVLLHDDIKELTIDELTAL